jgi:putative glycosyltransferase (TIGR04348 family)
MRQWKDRYPDRPLALVLTGTDLYRDIHASATARASLELADRLVVLQEKGLDELDPALRVKTDVIFQSTRPLARRVPPRRFFLVTVIGHLREVKDPFRSALALRLIDRDLAVRVVQLGKPIEAGMGEQARALMAAQPRYRWLGELDHARAMRWLARSHAMVISSRMEGGAHVVSEAIAAGVPVIASKISGNLGLLGEDYPGYYPVGDEIALAATITRAASDRGYLEALEAGVRARVELVDPRRERERLTRFAAALSMGAH